MNKVITSVIVTSRHFAISRYPPLCCNYISIVAPLREQFKKRATHFHLSSAHSHHPIGDLFFFLPQGKIPIKYPSWTRGFQIFFISKNSFVYSHNTGYGIRVRNSKLHLCSSSVLLGMISLLSKPYTSRVGDQEDNPSKVNIFNVMNDERWW